eukprot:512261_1
MKKSPPKKQKRNNDLESAQEDSKECSIVDTVFLSGFNETQCKNMIQKCLDKIIPKVVIKIIQAFSSHSYARPFFMDMWQHLTEYELDQFLNHRQQTMQLPTIMKSAPLKIGDIVIWHNFGEFVSYLVDKDHKLTQNVAHNSLQIPLSISENFNNPILYYSNPKVSTNLTHTSIYGYNFEIDLLMCPVENNFIQTYLSRFHFDQQLLITLGEIGIPTDMKSTLIFPPMNDEICYETHPYLQFDYLTLLPDQQNIPTYPIKICRKFYLSDKIDNTLKQIITWLKLLDLKELCFTKCQWTIWNKKEQNVCVQFLQNKLSEFGYWIEQSETDKSFIIKGNKNYIKCIKQILNNTENDPFIILGQLEVIKYFDENDSKKIIFEDEQFRTLGEPINCTTMHTYWHMRSVVYSLDCCAALFEGPLKKMDATISKIRKLNGGNMLFDENRIGSVLEFKSTHSCI